MIELIDASLVLESAIRVDNLVIAGRLAEDKSSLDGDGLTLMDGVVKLRFNQLGLLLVGYCLKWNKHLLIQDVLQMVSI